MNEMLRIRTAEQYFREYGVNGVGKGADKWMIRRQLIDAFHKEIFGLVAMRAKKTFDGVMPPDGDLEAMRIAQNVIKDAAKKWVKVCDMFNQYVETRGLIKYEDISIDPNELDKEVEKRVNE